MSASKNGHRLLNSKTPSQRFLRWRVPAICLALAGITFAVFGQTLHHEFIDFDDNDYVYENPVVAQGLTCKGVAWAFTQVHAANWHPLTWLSHMLDCQLYGLHPGGHHLTNVLIHTASVIVLFLVLRQMTGALWRSAFVAAVFAIHPLRVESVAWVAERKDVLSGLFFMLTLGAYVRYARRPGLSVCYGLVLLLFATGLMCKPMLVTLPVVLLLLDYWPLQRTESAWKLVLEKLPLLALSAAACLATVLAQTKLILPAGLLSLPLRFANAVVSCMVYLGQMVWPLGLAAYYPYPYQGPPGWEVAAGLTLLAGVSVLALWRRRKQPWILAGWLWYLVMLLPVMGLIQVGRQAHADRYTYLPQIGVYVALTWLVAGWRASRLVLGSLMAGVLAVLMVCASKQTAYWKDNETLWVHALACTTANDVAHFNLGNALRKEGRVDEATSHYQQAVQINPNYAEARFNLGTALFKKGSLDEAILQYQAALQIKPDYAKAHYNLGNALFKKGNVDGAVTEYQTALQIQPDYADAFNNLGNVLLQNARVDEAISQYQRALQINPTNARFHVNLGAALLQKGRMEETVAHFQKALQIEPANPEVQNNLAWILATGPQTPLRNGARALELANQANALTQGTDPVILHTLAAALAETGRFNDARRTAQKAIELARAAGQQELLDELNGELKRYSAGLPCHD